ncbi:MAG: hypoxanthine-guanine phosphoribosyltransferase [Gammaproteobacteria bacterium]|nr:hypoxanthine-guanine phosphoribosyltransferase [Gammaproteobacteria bacterium]
MQTPGAILAVHERATCLYNEVEVEAVLDTMATAITQRLAESNPILLSVMNGAVIVAGKLATRLHFPLRMDYLHATRYLNRTRGGKLEWKHTPDIDLTGQVVLVIDDILDEGDTLLTITKYLHSRGAGEVYTAVLVDKQHNRKMPDIKADFVGLCIADHYLYGYGMDYKGYLRNSAGIYAVDPNDCD